MHSKIGLSFRRAPWGPQASRPNRSGARRPDSPSGVLHEGRKRADRIARGLGVWNLEKVRPTRATSEPTVRSKAWHQRKNEGYQPIHGDVSSNLVNFKAESKSTTLRQEIRVTDSLTLHSIDKSIKHRVRGYT